jgi:hypothetical protein
MDNTYYVGADLKFKFSLSSEGFTPEEDKFSLTVCSGNRTVTWNSWDEEGQKHIILKDDGDEDDGWYLLIPTEFLATGTLKIIGVARVPDTDFNDICGGENQGIRREVAVSPNLGVIKKP